MSFDDDDPTNIVIDVGSCTTLSGFAGDDAPRSVISTVVGHKTNDYPTMCGCSDNEYYVGDEVMERKGVLSLNYPIDRGVVTDWDDMEKILHHIFANELRVSVEECPVLLTEPPLNPKHNREMFAQLLFEKFHVPAFYAANQGLLSCYASGRGSAIMLDVGHGVTHVVPVYEGRCPLPAVRRMDFGGKDLTTYMQELLHKKGHDFVTAGELDIVGKIKDSLCYVAEDIKSDLVKYDYSPEHNRSYTLPDGNTIDIDKERALCPEKLFQSNAEHVGIHKLLYDSIQACDIDIRRHYYTNIVISGRTTLFPGFPERLKKEISSLVPRNNLVKIIAAPERSFSVWIGGSILASLSTFQHTWISRSEYDEFGPDVVHRLRLY